jgi:hypothetical protein
VVRPTVSPIQARVLGAVLGVTGFAFASLTGIAASHAAADTHISDNTVWVTADGSDKGPPQGDAVRVISDCKDVDVWGNELHNDDGHFTIYFDNHEPSGDDDRVGTQDWTFDKKKDKQVIATIDSRELISELKDKGFHPQDDGWHIDLRFSDPEKEVEFILKNDCKEEEQGGQQGGEQGGESSPPVPVHEQAPPPPVVKGTTTQAPKAAAVVPQTGADAPFLTGLMLMSAGGSALGFARRLGRRRGR